LLIERVKQIKKLNQQNIIPDDLGAVEVNTGKPKEEELINVDLAGQISLKTLDKAARKKKMQRHPPQQQPRNNRPSQQPPGNKPPQQPRGNRPPQRPPRRK
jgi:hypothetical protein